MQSASTPGKMWTALPSDNASPLGTDVGLFDPAEFTFRVIAHYPDIRFTSDSMWVDEEGGFVYVADEVGLLRLPFGGVHPDR